MYNITDEQIEYILSDLAANGIETEDLRMNLLDHVCCIIEQNPEDEQDFVQYYHRIIKQFYKSDLKEIEIETNNLLTFKNYYAMKKAMIISGAVTAITVLTGSIFKLMHWPGAGAIFVLGILFFSLIFLPVLFLLKTKEMKTMQDKILLAIAVIVGSLYCLSAVVRVMHWPGGRIMWISTLTISFIVLLPLYFYNGIRRAETKMNTIITTIILTCVLGVQLLLTPIHSKANKISDTITTEVNTTAVKPG